MKVTANFDKRVLHLSGILGNIKSDINTSLNESATLVKQNIRTELKSPNKSGSINKNVSRRRSGGKLVYRRRSAIGESLARDTGASERLIASNKIGSNKIEVGFLQNPHGFDYVAFQELERNRPTVEHAVQKSYDGIQQIFERNLTPK